MNNNSILFQPFLLLLLSSQSRILSCFLTSSAINESGQPLGNIFDRQRRFMNGMLALHMQPFLTASDAAELSQIAEEIREGNPTRPKRV